MISFTFYNHVQPTLKPFIKHYWYSEGFCAQPKTHDLLPMDHVDLIIPLDGSFTYTLTDVPLTFDNVHFHGIREHPVPLVATKRIQTIGISFTPWGFYFLVRSNMSLYKNKILCLKDLNPSFTKELETLVATAQPLDNFICKLEWCLMRHLKLGSYDRNAIRTISESLLSEMPFKEYCSNQNLSIRTLQRLYNKYIGLSPTKFKSLSKFENATRSILGSDSHDLTEICYTHNYYDQPHFTNKFKSYTNHSPREFMSSSSALKKYMEYKG